MQKNCCVQSARSRGHGKLNQILLVMRFIVVLMAAAFLHVQANGVAQNVTISGKSMTLQECL